MHPLAEVFARAKTEDRAALIGYLPAGFPSVAGGQAALEALVEGGCDVLEVGLPYSDPLMDGPVIQRAVQAALDRGLRVSDVLATAGALAPQVATVVMTYYNPVDHYGVERFAAGLSAAGVAGVITPDLIPDEAGPWLAAATKYELDPVFLAAPSSTDARLSIVADASRGFIYAASAMGVTGTRTRIGSAASDLVGRLRAVTDKPVAVGLGVSNAAQAAEVAGYADGVIVGSAFVRALMDAPTESEGIAAVRELAAQLAEGVRAGS
ncbi:MAG TPA: tryptophan synthase subunit alpha [Frankiaceae bacterium]|nr:tryptophan synthase subunit alpha [Frankiaceae bacterium]